MEPASPEELDEIVHELMLDGGPGLWVADESGHRWEAGTRPLPSHYTREYVESKADARRRVLAGRVAREHEQLAGDALVEGERMSLREAIAKAMRELGGDTSTSTEDG
jgi:hypothetical protein